MKLFFILSAFLTTGAWANLHLAPPDFDYHNQRVIFIDFLRADYDLTYDVLWKKTTVKSKITFVATKTGNPIFDLLPNPKKVKLNGKNISLRNGKLPNGSKIRILNSVVQPGTHVLEMENTFKSNVRYGVLRNVSSAFWLRDLKERKFLEQYVPSNFEFDQYQMNLNITFKGIKKAHQDIYTNGELTQTSPNSYRIVFPNYFTASCPYFHTTPKGQKKSLTYNYRSIDGRDIPVTVYTSWWSNPSKFKIESQRIFRELENDYGPWGHRSFVAYETLPGTGGMEHSGAAQTSFEALDHEMLHSYFAKGVMPANGNAGWIDEAIASWRDKGYQKKLMPGYAGSNLGSGSVYKRNTDNRAYKLGAEFMAYLDFVLQDRGGLKAFLKGYFAAYKHKVITQEHFKNNLEFFTGLDLSDDFNTYIWGTNVEDGESLTPNPVHKNLSSKDLELML